MLRTVLALHAVFSARGLGLSTVPHAALSMGCSENRAGKLLVEAQGLAELPGAVEAVECGLLTVEQSGEMVAQLAALGLDSRLTVWRRRRDRLVAEVDRGSVLPPARLGELLLRS